MIAAVDGGGLPAGDSLAVIFQAIGGTGIAALVAWYIIKQARESRSKVDAATDDATLALLQENREDRIALRAELSGLRERVAVLEHERQQQFLVLQAHSAWDLLAVQVIRRLLDIIMRVAPHELGDADDYMIGDPPPLYPPDVSHKR